MRPLRVRERTLADGAVGWSVDGSPTDAVSLAFLGYFDIGFDLVASGINYGANLGDDVTYSGTVSAAMEAVINECPAFAISQEYYQHPDFTLAAPRRLPRRRQHPGARPGAGRADQHQRARHPRRRVPRASKSPGWASASTRTSSSTARSARHRRTTGSADRRRPGVAEEGTDFHAVVNRRIAITPIQLDLTARRLLGRLNSWPWDLPGKESDVPAAAEPKTRTDKRQDEVVTAQAEPKNERR